MIKSPRHLLQFADSGGRLAAPEHIAHFYENDEQFLDTLTAFVKEGLAAEESAIVIATPEHESALRLRLFESGIDVAAALDDDSYIPLDAEEALSMFLVNGWPDGQRFANLVEQLIKRATVGNRRARAFGEMVALMWARGQAGATVRLEDLWTQFSRSYRFPLLCSYPRAGFAKGPLRSLQEICSAHSRVIVEGDDAVGWKRAVSAQAAD